MTLRTAAAAVLARWDSPQWEWSKHGPTADLMHTLRAALAQPAAPDAQPDKWEGAEEWMPLAWELCAEECGEEACTELVWEGGPVPEPWGDRWLKYEDEAKRLIALVRKCTAGAAQVAQPPAPSAPPVRRERLTETQIDSASPVRIESAHWFKLGARWAERALIGGEG